MATISVASTLSNYSSRLVTVTVSKGLHLQGLKKRMTIPYSSLSQTIQSIHRFGGRIIDITLSSSSSFSLAPFIPSISSESAVVEALDLELELKPEVKTSTLVVTEVDNISTPDVLETPVQPLAQEISVTPPVKPPISQTNRGRSNQGKKSRRPNK